MTNRQSPVGPKGTPSAAHPRRHIWHYVTVQMLSRALGSAKETSSLPVLPVRPLVISSGGLVMFDRTQKRPPKDTPFHPRNAAHITE